LALAKASLSVKIVASEAGKKRYEMVVRQILFKMLSAAAQNPNVRREASKIASNTLEKSRPALLQGSRKLGEMTRAAGKEIRTGFDKFDKGRKGADE